jgi:hypothetical protein
MRRPSIHHVGFDDVDTSDAVDQIDQSAIVDRYVVGGRAIRALGVSGRNEPTSFGANGSAMSTRRSPWANHAKNHRALERSDGWWQPVIAGCGEPSLSRPATWKVATGTAAPRW